MSAAWGADVEAMRRLAIDIKSSGETIEQLANDVQAAYQRDHWRGDDAERCRAEWDQSLRQQLLSVSSQLVTASQTVDKNAEAQESASADTGGSSSTGGFSGVSGSAAPGYGANGSTSAAGADGQETDLPGRFRQWLEGTGTVMDWVDFLGDWNGAKWSSHWQGVGAALGIAGGVYNTADFIHALADGDLGQAIGSGVDAAISAAGVAATSVGVTAGIAKGYIDATLPYTAESQKSLFDYMAQKHLDKPASEMTGTEWAALRDRYEGVDGFLRMNSDKATQTVEQGIDGVKNLWNSGVNIAADWLSNG